MLERSVDIQVWIRRSVGVIITLILMLMRASTSTNVDLIMTGRMLFLQYVEKARALLESGMPPAYLKTLLLTKLREFASSCKQYTSYEPTCDGIHRMLRVLHDQVQARLRVKYDGQLARDFDELFYEPYANFLIFRTRMGCFKNEQEQAEVVGEYKARLIAFASRIQPKWMLVNERAELVVFEETNDICYSRHFDLVDCNGIAQQGDIQLSVRVKRPWGTGIQMWHITTVYMDVLDKLERSIGFDEEDLRKEITIH